MFVSIVPRFHAAKWRFIYPLLTYYRHDVLIIPPQSRQRARLNGIHTHTHISICRDGENGAKRYERNTRNE